jgi:hypothetical protein
MGEQNWMNAGFWWKDLDVDLKIILKWIVEK